jgi:hypothetical protein
MLRYHGSSASRRDFTGIELIRLGPIEWAEDGERIQMVLTKTGR